MRIPLIVAGLLLAGAVFPPGAARAADGLELQARGAQIYTCVAQGAGFAWQFKAPEARLTDEHGQDAGHHFAGPSWEAPDGSRVVGEVITSTPGGAGAIPWLLLRARTVSGAGVFGAVSYIVRSRTVGGVAPGAGCDASHAGVEAAVDYTASYTFFIDPAPGR